MKPKNNKILIALLIIACVLVSACSPGVGTKPAEKEETKKEVNKETITSFASPAFSPDASLEVKTFSSVEELEAFLRANEATGSSYNGGMMTKSLGRGAEMMDFAMPTSAPTDLAVESAGGSDDFSTTNNQVAGVDEGDIIKTDGKFIYTVSGKTLFIVKAYPGADAKIISETSFEKGVPSGLFISGDKLVVFGYLNDYEVLKTLNLEKYGSYASMTFVEIYDMNNKEKLVLEKEFLLDGDYFESRMIDGFVYIVTNSYPSARPWPVPYFVEDNIVREVAMSSIRYFPLPYESVSFVTINAFDLDNLEHVSETLAIESSRTMYMSEKNMYISYTKYINEWEIVQDATLKLVKPLLSDADKSRIKKIEAVDNDILTAYEKEQKVMTMVYRYLDFLSADERESLQELIDADAKAELEKYDYFEYTVIHRVELDGLSISPKANGQVPGYANNQFAFDEFKGTLRLATTVSPHWSSYNYDEKNMNTESENFVFTLDEDLNVLDSLDGIAPNENIYSTRFMGDKLYMVTFRQVDPFFVIDLSNPKDIKSLGKLKIPGFSRYLHPYDENHIIGLGRDATDMGRVQGLKISIFDVSDVTNPKEVAKWESVKQYSSSTAEYEHKAFLFDKEKNLLVIPAYSYEWDNGVYDGYNGALVFDIKADSIEIRGLIDHSKSTDNNWGAAVERSLFIDDMLYTKSYSLLRINALKDLKSVKDIELKSSNVEEVPIY
jgi:uncharacterized secreted protein with C-terminal beta-propeller domain